MNDISFTLEVNATKTFPKVKTTFNRYGLGGHRYGCGLGHGRTNSWYHYGYDGNSLNFKKDNNENEEGK